MKPKKLFKRGGRLTDMKMSQHARARGRGFNLHRLIIAVETYVQKYIKNGF